jgi:hypothetical protein
MEELEMKGEVIEISGDRKLYNYTFLLDGEEIKLDPPAAPPAAPEG